MRRKEIAAETKPLLSAVKKAEVKMLKPESRKEKENRRNACSVSGAAFVVADEDRGQRRREQPRQQRQQDAGRPDQQRAFAQQVFQLVGCPRRSGSR